MMNRYCTKALGKCSFIAVLLLMIGFTTVNAQSTVTGIITDTDGTSPLPGASVIEKGTSNGTQTDFDGNYSLTIDNPDATLVFSYIGYAGKEVPVAGKSVVNVTLQEDVSQLDEVVLIGYGSARKSDVTGAMSSVKAEDFNKGVTISPQQLLQGKAAGVNITQSSGEPGANASVRIRGTNSLTSTNEPLYVVDGVPISFSEGSLSGNTSGDARLSRTRKNPLNLINSADIESIDILKDASATAIYGSRAANGVVLITTKSGKEGRTSISYNTYTGFSTVRKQLDVLTADEIRNFANTAGTPLAPRNDFTAASAINGGDGGVNTDWQDEIFQTGVSTSHSLAFSGGSEKTTYRASLGYLSQDGIVRGSGIRNLNSRVNINSKFFDDKLNITLNIINSNERNNNATLVPSTGGEAGGDIIKDALRALPTLPVRDANGDYSYLQLFVYNPLEEALELKNLSENNRLLANITTDFEIAKDLHFITNVGVTREDTKSRGYIPTTTRPGGELAGLARLQSDQGESDLLELTLNYKTKLFGDDNLTLLGGYTWQEFRGEGMFIQRRGFNQDITGFNNIEAGAITDNADSFAFDRKLISFLGRIQYDLKNKYLLTASYRRDGSTVLGQDNKWDDFKAFALGWKISEENFLKESTTLSNLKLRLGYGETGNERIGPYRSQFTVNTNTSLNSNVGSFATYNNGNPSLKWETTKQSNIGLDYGLFNGRIYGSIEYYLKNTTDLLLNKDNPSAFISQRRVTVNLGEIENKGVEFDINASIINKEKFSLDFYGNISKNENTILQISSPEFPIPYFDTFDAPSTAQIGNIIRQEEGQPINSYYLLEFTGFDQDGNEVFKDLDNNGIIDDEDRAHLGDANPDYSYGFGLNMTAGAFSFGAAFRGVEGVQLYNSLRNELEDISKLPSINALRSVLEGGQSGPPSTKPTSRFLEDASFLRLDNVTLGYDIDTEKISFISALNLYVTGQNLFVLTDYSGFDPEVSRVDFTTFPKPTTYILGLRAQF